VEFTVPPDHPALAGHFPGRPVVPAVVILDEVLAGLSRFDPELRPEGFASAKFTAVLKPGETCSLSFERRGNGVRFACLAGGRAIASGVVALAP
jgi:3-hydroxymyristoyl/3-hydroxydecanoyl-(acyl carrier protein) dehydratase